MGNNFHSDVIVVGGGAAGVAAAVAAAKAGQQVTLFERNSFLGGKATAAEVGTICGLYTFSKKKESEYIVNGFAKAFAEQVRIASKTAPIYSLNGLHYLPYNIEVFKATCQQWLAKHGVEVYYNAVVTDVTVSENEIKTVSVDIKGAPCTFFCKAIIDCSGESTVSKLANLPLIKSDHFQAAAQVFTLENLRSDGLNEASLGLLLMKELTNAIHQNRLENYFDRVYVVPGTLQNGRVSLKVGIPLAVNYAPENKQELRQMALVIIDKLISYLNANVSVFEQVQLESIAPEVGIRIGLRGKGKYILTEEDVLGCKKFDDAIANASWPIEEWEQDRRVRMQYFSLEDFYQIPAGCLQSGSAENLFFAGRHISATDSAIASARVIGICLQTGYAAGNLAAKYCQNHLAELELEQR